MKLFIEKETLVEDIKKIFVSCYPFLKIELYKKPFGDNYIIKKQPLASGAGLAKFIHVPDKTTIDINNNITVEGLENQFEDIGLVAEVFRRSGKVWVETTLTNNWTLDQQNLEGEEMSLHFKEKKIQS